MVPPTSHKVSRVSWYFGYCLSLFVFPYGAFTLSGRLSQYRSGNSEYNLLQSLTLQCTHRSLGSFPFARRYSGNRVFFLFLRLLRCFSSPGSLPYVMDWRMDTWSLSRWVSPFGYLRINGYLLLPAAFRSLSRPSSALSAKASTLRSFLFDLPVLLAFKTGGSLAVSFHRVYNVMSSYCFDSLSLKDNSSDVSFSYL